MNQEKALGFASSPQPTGYDLAGRLTQLNRNALGKLDYRYDPAGNITAIGTQSYAYDALDRLTQAPSRSYNYDANGNRTQDGTQTYSVAPDSTGCNKARGGCMTTTRTAIR